MRTNLDHLSKLPLCNLTALLMEEKRLREDVVSSSNFLVMRVGESKINIEDFLVESFLYSDAITNEIKKRLVEFKKDK